MNDWCKASVCHALSNSNWSRCGGIPCGGYMLRLERSGGVHPVLPIESLRPCSVNRAIQSLYSTDHLLELPGFQVPLMAQSSQVLLNLVGPQFAKPLLWVRLNELLCPLDMPAVEGWLDTLFSKLLNVSVPEAGSGGFNLLVLHNRLLRQSLTK